MRLKLFANVLQNSFCGILDEFIVKNLLRGVYQSNLKVAVHFAMLVEQKRPIQPICFAHTTAQSVASVSPFVELLGCGEEQLGTQGLVAILGIDHIAQWVHKPSSPLGK